MTNAAPYARTDESALLEKRPTENSLRLGRRKKLGLRWMLGAGLDVGRPESSSVSSGSRICVSVSAVKCGFSIRGLVLALTEFTQRFEYFHFFSVNKDARSTTGNRRRCTG